MEEIKSYGFIGTDGILKLAAKQEYALERAMNKTCVEVNLEFADGGSFSGYPVAEFLKEGRRVKRTVIVYSDSEMYIDGAMIKIKPIPYLALLYKGCRGF